MNKEARTPGELVFEQYLTSQGYTDFEHEKAYEGKSQRPDYAVRIEGAEYLFDVKDFNQSKPLPTGFFSGDQSGPLIREKINAGRKKFKEYRGQVCCLVLYNVDMLLLELEKPYEVYAAMEGDLGIRMIFDTEKGHVIESTITNAFLEGGKMINPKTRQSQNTTISALIVPRYVRVGNAQYGELIRQIRKTSQLPDEEFYRKGFFDIKPDFDVEEKQLGVITYESRHAHVPFPRHLFRGPYDERFTYDGQKITRIFAGEGVPAYEALKNS